MRRMRELISEVQVAYPSDRFFATLDETLRSLPQSRASYRAYERAFSGLDLESWHELKRKAIGQYCNHRNGQLKQGFFNQLNEAFAYQYLVRKGYRNVAILREDGNTIPDLAYYAAGSQRFCEVKTIGISDDEIARSADEQSFDSAIYKDLSEGFMNKFIAVLTQAQRQIASRGSDGLIFVVAKFDDFTLQHYDRYRVKLCRILLEHEAQEVFVKVGLIGGRRIFKPRPDPFNPSIAGTAPNKSGAASHLKRKDSQNAHCGNRHT